VGKQSVAAPVIGRQNIPRNAALPQLPDESAAAGSGTVGGAPRSPVVTYKDGQLTINAETSTLADVLKLVAEKTGAEIEVPPGTGLDRVIEHAGPGRAEEVLASLLNGSPFDFVIVNSPQPPHDLTQVLLFLHRPMTPAALDQTVSASAEPKTPIPPPSAADPSAAVKPPPVESGSLPPREALTPEALGQLMREKSRQLHDQIQQQQQTQQ